MNGQSLLYHGSMKCGTVGCPNEVPPNEKVGRPKRYCSGRCRDNRQQRQYKKLREFSDNPKVPFVNLGTVTQNILDSLGVDERPDQHGNYRSTEVQVFYGGTDSWGDQLFSLEETPIKSGSRIS